MQSGGELAYLGLRNISADVLLTRSSTSVCKVGLLRSSLFWSFSGFGLLEFLSGFFSGFRAVMICK